MNPARAEPTLRKLIGFFLLLVVVIVGVSGCNIPFLENRKELAFGELIDATDVNDSIVIRLLDDRSQTTEGRIVFLEVVNRSGSPVVFPADFGAVGYYFDSSSASWNQVANRIEYPQGKRLLGAEDSEVFNRSTFEFSPDVKLDEDMLRITIEGNTVHENGEIGPQVAAYLDISMP